MTGAQRLLACLVTVAVLLPGALGSAQPTPLQAGDYGLENKEWNGLSDFVRLAASRDIELRPAAGIDYAKLTPQDRLVIVYPTREIEPDTLASFVVDGGKVLLLDDFGASTQLLGRLGIERIPAADVPHETVHMGRPGLPIFRPGGKHPLLDGVHEVVANHPAALRTDGGAILPYDDPSAGLVYDMRLGEGKVVVVADSSVVINHMLQVGDNREFLTNALRYICRDVDGECRPYLLVGDFVLAGRYASQSDPRKDVSDWASDVLGALNDWLDDLADDIPHKNAIYYASLLLMVGLIIFAVTIFPWRKARPVRPAVGPPEAVKPLSEFEWNLLRYERGGFQANHALPMSILKTEFERLFFREVVRGESVPPQDDPRRVAFLKTCAQRYVERYREDLGASGRKGVFKEIHGLLRQFSRIPPRHRLFLDSEAYFSQRELMSTWRKSREILDIMGVGEEYEQRTRRSRRG